MIVYPLHAGPERTVSDVRTVSHPAKFSAPILDAILHTLRTYVPVSPLFPPRILDPFAGVGTIHQLRAHGYDTVGIELEADWAAASEHTTQGDATRLPFSTETFDAVATSPCYGNRMADAYDGSRDRCTACSGTGSTEFAGAPVRLAAAVVIEECPACAGTGLKPSTRYTYRIALGHELAHGSAAGMQWGVNYRELHRAAWAEAHRVLRPRGMLLINISDHIRNGDPQGVDLWHAATAAMTGFRLLEAIPIRTKRSKNGANRDARTLCEWLLVFRKLPGGPK